jgi:hypothetical protein
MNANEALLQKLIADPSLMKLLEKMSKDAPAVKKEKKLKELGAPCFVNEVELRCKLCSSIEIVFMRMDWDSEAKLYRGGCYSLDNLWKHLPLKQMIQRKATCKACSTVLHSMTKEALVQKVIVLAERLQQSI